MRLTEFARREGVSYQTALRWYHDGYLNAHRMPGRASAIIIDEKNPFNEKKISEVKNDKATV